MTSPRNKIQPSTPPLVRRWWHEIPMWLFYVPIGLAVIVLSLRHLSPLAAMKANPGLPKGGLFPASKQDFFNLFPKDCPLLPVSMKLAGELDEASVLANFDHFTEKLGQMPDHYVVKPDDGVRGQDIRFFRTRQDLKTFWSSPDRGDNDWLLQEYVDGLEVALFYDQQDIFKPGRILSMTLKHGYPVTGDGQSTISQLIDNADADTSTRYRVKKTNQHRLTEVLPPGQITDLIAVRNHHLGATFQDVSEAITPELEQMLCKHLDPIEGFRYGRLDCRVPDFRALQRGKGLKALEVNALYSEPVHAYDPKYGLFSAYHIFVWHWYQAIKTGLGRR